MIRPEDEPKINKMVLSLKRSKEIACILLVLYNDELLRQDIEAELKRKLEPEGFNFRELRMTEDMYKNVPVIITREMNPQPNDIFQVFDLKKALPEVLEYLNYRREDFVEHKISVIFWLDEPTLIEIMRKALDFFAFRATPVIEFMADRSKDMIIPGRTTLSEIFIYNSLEELDKKIALREEMLNDYLEKRPDDHSTIAGLYNNLGLLYSNRSDFDKAILYYEKAYDLIKKINDKKTESAILANIGSVYYTKGDLDKSFKSFMQALEINRKIGDISGEAGVLGNIGNIYHITGELDKALEYHMQALEMDRRIGNIQAESEQLGNIGVIYQSKGELDKSLEYHLKSLDTVRKIKYINGEANQLSNLGLIYQARGEIDKALECHIQALEIHNKLGNIQEEAVDLRYIGIIYQIKGKLDKALEYFSQSLSLHQKIGDAHGIASTLDNIGWLYFSKKDLNKALTYTKKAVEIFISNNMVLDSDITFENLQIIITQMKSRGIEISQEDAKEITELTEQYEKLKAKTA